MGIAIPFNNYHEVEEGATFRRHLTSESGEVKVADEVTTADGESSVKIAIPELSPDDELPVGRVKIKVTRKLSYWRFEAEIAEVEEGATFRRHITSESGEVKMADGVKVGDGKSSIKIVIPELSPDDELPDDRVFVKVTRKISVWKFEAEIYDAPPQTIEGTQKDAKDRYQTMKDGFGDSNLMSDILNKH